jgi:NAD(P)H dehydrogenase (quinone)
MIALTGASGQFGQRVLHHLLDSLKVPAAQIVAGSRDTSKLAAAAARGVTVRALDFEAPETLASAFAGVDRALLISTDALDRPGRRLAQHRAGIDAMVQAGVKHVVYTSMPLPDDSPLLIAPDHAGTEAALAASPLPGWTVLRNHWYFENLVMFMGGALASGQWYAADGSLGSADIARDDLAYAAAVALAGSETGRATYTLSGPAALTKAEIAAQVGAVVGKSITVVQVPLEGLVQGMVGAGLPEPLARVFASFDTNTAAGRVATVTGDYERLTGRAPRPFADWLADNQAAFGAR